MGESNLWWGYKHTNGSHQAKRYFDNRDVVEASKSPFCEKVVGPFEANSREEALKKVEEQTEPKTDF